MTPDPPASARATAVAVAALHLANPFEYRAPIDAGLRWLAGRPHADGGWGDAAGDESDVPTTLLGRAAFALTGAVREYMVTVENTEAYLTRTAGKLPERRADAVRRGSGPGPAGDAVLMTCALADLVPWDAVPRRPAGGRDPVAAAVGLCARFRRRSRNPLRAVAGWLARGATLRAVRGAQAADGGFGGDVATTGFVVVAVAAAPAGRRGGPAVAVVADGGRFLAAAARADGGWPAARG